MRLSIETKIRAGFALALAVLVILGLASYRSTAAFDEIVELEEHSVRVLRALEALHSSADHADKSGLDYIVTGRQDHLDVYRLAAGTNRQAMKDLRALTAGAPNRHQGLDRLQPLIEARLEQMQWAIDARAREGAEAAMAPILGEAGKKLADDIQGAVDAMREEEWTLFKRRDEEAHSMARAVTLMIALGSLLGIATVAVANLVIHRDMAARRRAEEELKELLEELEHRVAERTGQLEAARRELEKDVAARKRTEESLLKFKLAPERSGEAIFITDIDGAILYANPAFEQTYGYSREDVLGKTPRILKSGLLTPEDYGLFWDTLLAKRIVSGEMVNRTRDGRFLSIEGSANPILNEQGDIIGFLAIQRDITERKQLEEQLRRAHRLETAGKIAGQVAHDFNNLLAPLMAYPELIKMRLPEEHVAVSFCDSMLEAAQQMADINEDMMALARRGRLDQQPTDLNPIVERAVEQMPDRPETVAIDLDLAPDLLPVGGSPSQLSRVISNLLSNALEAMQGTGLLSAKTENVYVDRPFGRYNRVEVGEYVRLTVSDTGCGIPAENMDKIFDAFFTTKHGPRRRGSGLGLSIVQAIVGDHRGYVDVESDVGRGTAFYVYLPVSRETARIEPAEAPQGGTERVLVVDDDPLQLEVASALLQTLGYQVEVVSSGERAVAHLKEHSAELLVLDMIMPAGIDGAETYRRVLEVRPDLRAVIVSGFAGSEQVQRAQALGAGAFVRKPVTREKLARAVREELDRGRRAPRPGA